MVLRWKESKIDQFHWIGNFRIGCPKRTHNTNSTRMPLWLLSSCHQVVPRDVTRYFELAPLILLQWLECLIMLCCNWGPLWSYYRCGSLIHWEGYKLIKWSNNAFGSPWEGMSGQFWVRGREEGRFEEKGCPGVAKVAALSQLMDNILVRCQFLREPFNSDFHRKSC